MSPAATTAGSAEGGAGAVAEGGEGVCLALVELPAWQAARPSRATATAHGHRRAWPRTMAEAYHADPAGLRRAGAGPTRHRRARSARFSAGCAPGWPHPPAA